MMHPALTAFLVELGIDPDRVDSIEFSWERGSSDPAQLTMRLAASAEDIDIDIVKVLG